MPHALPRKVSEFDLLASEAALSARYVAKNEAAFESRTESPRIHIGVVKSYVGIHALLFAILFMTFSIDGEASFMVAISAFYLSMYLGTPYVLSLVGNKRFDRSSSWSAFLDAPHDTFTGPISGREAWIQMCLIPLATLIALGAICVIIVIARAG